MPGGRPKKRKFPTKKPKPLISAATNSSTLDNILGVNDDVSTATLSTKKSQTNFTELEKLAGMHYYQKKSSAVMDRTTVTIIVEGLPMCLPSFNEFGENRRWLGQLLMLL